MTIDQLIEKLNEAKRVLPSGGAAPVTFPDYLLLKQVRLEFGHDAVTLSDQTEDGESSEEELDNAYYGKGDLVPDRLL